MNKYKVGDKVVIRKDLEVDGLYGIVEWHINKEYLKEKDYVVIDKVVEYDVYWTTDEWAITDEMIEGLYQETSKNKYKVGDKVVIRKDLVVEKCYGMLDWSSWMEYMKKEDYVIIEKVTDSVYLLENGWGVTDEMISHKHEENSETEKPNLKGSINDNIEYKVDDPVLFDSIASFHIDSLINKALEENNTEMLLKISEYMKGGGHIDIA